MEDTLKNQGIFLQRHYSKQDIIEIDLIESAFSEVIMNIINNAKEALLSQKIENKWIKVTLENSSNNISISIEDNAGGIPENILQKIFDPYFTTKHQEQGVGLGLNISYKLVVEQLNGKLNVKYTQYGANFFLELPRHN